MALGKNPVSQNIQAIHNSVRDPGEYRENVAALGNKTDSQKAAARQADYYMGKYNPNKATASQRDYAQTKDSIDRFDAAVAYLQSGASSFAQTKSFLAEANAFSKQTLSDGRPTEMNGYWSAIANDLKGKALSDASAIRSENNKAVDELDKQIENAKNSARSTSDAVTFWTGEYDDEYAATVKKSKDQQEEIRKLIEQRDKIASQTDYLNRDLREIFITPEILGAEQRLTENKYGKLSNAAPDKRIIPTPFRKASVPTKPNYSKEDDQALVDDFYEMIGAPRHYFNKEDEWKAGVKAWAGKTDAALVGGFSWGVQAEALVMQTQVKTDIFGRPIVPEDYAGSTYKPTTISNPREGNEMLAGIKNRISQLETEKSNLQSIFKTTDAPDTTGTGKMFRSRNLSGSVAAFKTKADARTRLEEINHALELLYLERDNIDFQLKTMTGQETSAVDKMMHLDSKEFGEYLNGVAGKLDARAAEEVEKIKYGKSDVAKAGIDLGMTLGDILADQIIGAATGTGEIGALSSMALRSFGSSVNEARRIQDRIYNQKAAEADFKGTELPERNYEQELFQQGAFAAAHTAVEIATEKLGNIYGFYGGGLTDDIVDDLIMKSADTYMGQVFYGAIYNAMGEASEELISWLFDPFCQWIIDESTRGSYFKQLDIKEGMYDALMGFMASFAGTSLSIASGGEKASYQERQQGVLQKNAEDQQKFDTMLANGDQFTKQDAKDYKAYDKRLGTSKITALYQQYQDLRAKYPDGNIPENEQMSRQDAGILRDAGVIDRGTFNMIALAPGKEHKTADEIRADQRKAEQDARRDISGGGNNKSGYIGRNKKTDATQHMAGISNEPGPLVKDEKEKVSGEWKGDSNSSFPNADKDAQQPERATGEHAGAPWNVSLQPQKGGGWVVGYDYIGVDRTQYHTYPTYEAAKAAYDERVAEFAPKAKSDKGNTPAPPDTKKEVKPAPTAPESSPESETPEQKRIRELEEKVRKLEEEKAAGKKKPRNPEKAAKWKEEDEALKKENAERKEADDKAIDNAEQTSTEVSFPFTRDGKNYTVSWDGDSHEVVVKDENGNKVSTSLFPEFKGKISKNDKIGPGALKRIVNKFRSTLNDGRAKPAEASKPEAKVEEPAPAQPAETLPAGTPPEGNRIFETEPASEEEALAQIEEEPEEDEVEEDLADEEAPARVTEYAHSDRWVAEHTPKTDKEKADFDKVKNLEYTPDELKAGLKSGEINLAIANEALRQIGVKLKDDLEADLLVEFYERRYVPKEDEVVEAEAPEAEVPAQTEAITADQLRSGSLTYDQIKTAHANGTLTDDVWTEVTGTPWNSKKNSGTYKKFLSQLETNNLIENTVQESKATDPANLAKEIINAYLDAKERTKTELADLASARSDFAKGITDTINGEFEERIKSGELEAMTMSDFKEIVQDIIKQRGASKNVATDVARSGNADVGRGTNPDGGGGQIAGEHEDASGVDGAAQEEQPSNKLGGKGKAILSAEGIVKGKDGKELNLLDEACKDYGITDIMQQDDLKAIRQMELDGYTAPEVGMKVIPEKSKRISGPIRELLDLASKFGSNTVTLLGGKSAKPGAFRVGGYCLPDAPMFGPTLVLDRKIPKSRRSIYNLTGTNAAHEYDHHWGDDYAFKNGGKRPAYADGVKEVAKHVGIDNFYDYALGLYLAKVNDNAAKMAARYGKARDILGKPLKPGKITPGEAQVISNKFNSLKTVEERLNYVRSLAGKNVAAWEARAAEECMMEFASAGVMFDGLMKATGIDSESVHKAAQAWLEEYGGVPKGWHEAIAPIVEKLNAEHQAFLDEMDAAIEASKQEQKEQPSPVDSAAADTTATKEYTAPRSGKKTPVDIFKEKIVKPRFEVRQSQSAETQQKTSSGERAQAGPFTHEAVTKAEMQRSAEESVKLGLEDPDIGWRGIYGYFLSKDPEDCRAYEQEIADVFASRLNTERTLRNLNNGHIFDKSLPADYDLLSQMADAMLPYGAASRSEGSKKMRAGTVMPKYESVINDAKNAYLGDVRPDDIDWKSENAQMVKVVADHAVYTKSIEDRYEAAEKANNEEEKQKAIQDMVKEIVQVNQVRDVSKTFGLAGKSMQALESAFLNRIANKSPEAFKTLTAMAYSSIDRICYDFNKVGAINTVKQIRYMNMLSNVATILNNVLNNLESSTSGATAQNLGMLVAGKHARKQMGGEDTMSFNRNYIGLFSKKNQELNSYMLTKGAESVLSLYYGLDVDEGKYETGKDVARFNQNSNAAGRLLARFQFLSGLGMQTTDAMAIERAYRGMLMGIEKMNVSEQRKAELRKDAMWEAKRQMYHNDDGLAGIMSNIRDWANNQLSFRDENGSLGAGDILMPFVAVPVNVATRAMRATVPGQLVGLVNYARNRISLDKRRAQFDEAEALRAKMRRDDGSLDSKKLTAEEWSRYEKIKGVKPPTDAEVRKNVRTLGEVMNNALMTVVGGVATAFGALKNFDDEDDEEAKRLAKEKGFTGLQFNLTKMITRPLDKEWRDDDIILGGSWLEVLALPFAAGHTIAREALDADEGKGQIAAAMNAAAASPLTTFDDFVDIVTEMPGMNQMMDIWNAYESLSWSNNFEEAFKQAVGSSVSQYSANTISSFFIPNILSQASAGIDNKVRDVYGADTNREVFGRILLNKTPFRYKLPEVKSSLNETRTYGSTRARGVLNRMILPGTGVQVWRQSELEKEYAALREAGFGGVAAAASAPKNIKIDGVLYGLDAKERAQFDADYTRMVNDWQNQLLHTPGYKEMDAGERDAAMTEVRTLANLICEHNAMERKKNAGLVPTDVDVNFENWQTRYQNDPAGLNRFLIGKHQLKQFYGKNKDGAFEVKDYAGLDKYLKTDYMKLDKDARTLLDASYPSIDKMYNAQSEVGIGSKEYMELNDIYKTYNERAKDQDYKKANDMSVSEISRDMIVDFSKHVKDEKLDWCIDNFAIYTPIRANIKTPQKLVDNTSLDWEQADHYLDWKSSLQPAGDHKGTTQNQILKGIAANKDYTEAQKWELIEVDGDISDSAYAKLSPYMKVGYEGSDGTLQYAITHAKWWRATKFTGWKPMRYDVIYNSDWTIAQ